MRQFIEYIIPHKGLSIGQHDFYFDVNGSFFEQFENSIISKSEINIHLQLEKRFDMLVLDFDINGTFRGSCDRCLVDIDVPISGLKSLMIKYSEDPLDDEEEVSYISPLDHEINVAQYIYEFVILCKPLGNRRDCEEEQYQYCDKGLLDKLEQTIIEDDQSNGGSQWDALKNINFES